MWFQIANAACFQQLQAMWDEPTCLKGESQADGASSRVCACHCLPFQVVSDLLVRGAHVSVSVALCHRVHRNESLFRSWLSHRRALEPDGSIGAGCRGCFHITERSLLSAHSTSVSRRCRALQPSSKGLSRAPWGRGSPACPGSSPRAREARTKTRKG